MLINKKYDVLFIDLDNTLVDFLKSEQKAIELVYTNYFTDIENININKFNIIFKKSNHILWNKYENDEIDLDKLRIQRFQSIIDDYKIKSSAKDLANSYENALSEYVYLYEESIKFLKWASANFSLIMVSNGLAKIQRMKISKVKIDKYFNHILLSQEVGFRKPNIEIFQKAILLSKVNRERILMIGDSLKVDCKGSHKANIDFCWVNRKKEKYSKIEYSPKIIINTLNELLPS